MWKIFPLIQLPLLLVFLQQCKATQHDYYRVQDRVKIENFLYDYCHAVDTRNWEFMKTLFLEDANMEYDITLLGFQVGSKGSTQEIVDGYLKKNMDPHSWSQHMVTNIRIEFHNEKQATATAKLYNPQEMYGFAYVTGGTYTHELEKQDDGSWKSRSLYECSHYISLMIKLEVLCAVAVLFVGKLLLR